MKKVHPFAIAAVLFALAGTTGCGNRQGDTPTRGTSGGEAARADRTAAKGGEDKHDHGQGPHGGTVFDFGKWHAEFTVDHKAQQATVYILGGDAAKAAPIGAENLLLSVKKPPFQVELMPLPQDGDPKGKSSRFAGKHERLGKEQEFEGTLSGVIDGKPYAGDFKEEEAGDHKPEKK